MGLRTLRIQLKRFEKPGCLEARNRKLTVFAMSLYFFFCVLWAYFVITDGMSTNRGLQQTKFEE